MIGIPTRARVKSDGSLDLHLLTGLPESDVEVIVIVQPSVRAVGGADDTWAPGFIESTYGSLRDDPLTIPPEGAFEVRRELE